MQIGSIAAVERLAIPVAGRMAIEAPDRNLGWRRVEGHLRAVGAVETPGRLEPPIRTALKDTPLDVHGEVAVLHFALALSITCFSPSWVAGVLVLPVRCDVERDLEVGPVDAPLRP